MTTINKIQQIYIFLASAAAIVKHKHISKYVCLSIYICIQMCACVCFICCLINANTHTLTFFCVNLSDLISHEGLQVVGTVGND